VTFGPAPRTVVIVVHCAHAFTPGERLVCDVRELTHADERALDALARLHLTARRLGATISLRHASRALTDLVDLAGLGGVLVVDDAAVDAGVDAGVESGVEVDGQGEEAEILRTDEEVDPGDGLV
jgi:hypothetical protein